MALIDELKAAFPWLEQTGFTPEFFQQLAAESVNGDELMVRLRQSAPYKARFSGIMRNDGSLRMSETEYVQTENAYRQLLRQYGYGDAYQSSTSLVGFFDSEVDPNELKDRLATYEQIKNAGQSVKDAFYVYAGLDVTNDDLYQAAVDPAAAQRLQSEYNQRVASSTFDYTSWITRATEVGLQRVADTLGQLQKNGAVTGTAVQAVLKTDPTFARSIMDALYTNAGQSTDQPLALNELISSFEYAAIGAAAKNAGLEMPTKERIAAIRAQGIDRSKAQSSYVQYGMSKAAIDDAVRRASGEGFSQSNFEDAAFFGDASQQSRLQNGMAREAAAGEAGGRFGFDVNRQGRLTQRSMTTV